MRLLVLLIALSAPSWGAFSKMFTVTVNHAKVNTDQTNFMFTVALSDASLKDVADGGNVQSTSGYDIWWYLDAARTQPICNTIVKYDGVNGIYSARMTLPGIYTATDVLIYAFLGDASITSPQPCSTGSTALPANIQSYYPPYSGLTANAISSGPTGTLGSTTPTLGSGPVDNAITFAGSANSYMRAAGLGQQRTYTSCLWAKRTAHVSGFGDSVTGDNDSSSTWDAQNILTTTAANHVNNGATDGSGNSYWASGVTAAPANGTWFHACAVMSAGVSNKIYVNGALEATTSLVGVTIFNGGTTYLAYGVRGADTNASFAPFWNGLASDMLWSSSVWTAGQIANLYANQSNLGNFGVSAGTAFYDVGTLTDNLTSSWPYLPLNKTTQITLAGNGTSWGGGTTFSVSGVSGASVASQTVNSTTSATLNITTGNVTGTLVISDGILSTAVQIVSTGLQMSWGGPWRYNSKNPGQPRDGDTWEMAALDSGSYLVMCNDCYSAASNVAISVESSDLNTITLVNALSGFGGAGATALGLCAAVSNGGVDGTVKSGPPFRRGEIIGIPFFCQQATSPFYALNPTVMYTTQTDGGAHLFRQQDAIKTTAGSCAAGTVTLTMNSSPGASVGDYVIVHNVGVAADVIAVLTAGTSGTTLKYATTCSGGSYTQGWAATATSAHAANGNPWTSAVTNLGTFARMIPFQICATGLGCGGPDSSDSYMYAIVNSDSTRAGTLMRWAWSDWDSDPTDSTKLKFYDGANWTMTDPSAATCPLYYYANGTLTRNCTYGTNPIYLSDSNLPDGGQYFVCNSYGQVTCATASHFTGPWFANNSNAVSYNQNPPVATGIPGGNPRLYTAVGSSPYKGRIRVQVSGQYTDTVPRANYSPFFFDVGLSLREPNASPLFNTSRAAGYAGYAGGQHIQKGLLSMWRFLPVNNFLTDSLVDEGPQQKDIAVSGGNANYPYQAISTKGLENPNSGLNSYWPANTMGGTWSVSSGFGNSSLASGDFSTAAVFASTATGTQVLLGPSQTGNVGFSWKLLGTAVHFIVRNGASIDITCPSPLTTSTMTAYIGIRKGATGYCFRYGVASPASGGSDSASLGTYTLWLGSEADGTKHYFDGTVGTLAIWNRALCSNYIAATCSAGQPDEVIREFGALVADGAWRGWSLAVPTGSNYMTFNLVTMTWNGVAMTWH